MDHVARNHRRLLLLPLILHLNIPRFSVNWQTTVRFVFQIPIELFYFANCSVKQLFIPTLLLNFLKYFPVIISKIGSESGCFDGFDEVFEDLSNRILFLLLQNIQEKHKLIFSFFAKLNVFVVFAVFYFHFLFDVFQYNLIILQLQL